MIKKTMYPKTKRVGNKFAVITEKLDGSNLGFFNDGGKLLIAQRNNVFYLDSLEENSKRIYKGLYQWLLDHGEELQSSLIEGSGMFGEWIGMGRLSYGDTLDKRFYMFAKANLDENKDTKNIIYARELFIYPFEEQQIPDFIGVVPEIKNPYRDVSIEVLDRLYDEYVEKVGRRVEGFIVNSNNQILKYVRDKGGALEPHYVGKE